MKQLDILTLLVVLLALLLTGCGVDTGSDAHADESANWPDWTGEWQERNDRFTLNYDPVRKPGPWMAVVDQIWLDVQTCVGIAAPGPGLTVEYVPLAQLPITEAGNQVGAFINYKDRYVRVHDEDLSAGGNHLRHELVHYLLWWAGSSQHDLATHNSQFYDECLV